MNMDVIANRSRREEAPQSVAAGGSRDRGGGACHYGGCQPRTGGPGCGPQHGLDGGVERGAFVRQVRGHGTLVPKDLRWVPAPATGQVE